MCFIYGLFYAFSAPRVVCPEERAGGDVFRAGGPPKCHSKLRNVHDGKVE